ncbi:S26 family signal peptidase [Micromonospora robiginosa]|uniref:S26 family signal peptidase n=1 Tax=Micromonospora robiginosa TaxID=2749844 RepID=A0A7L6B843_9ACTN|nr:S26 family signal peptidase [Micromonospora ferruginea]QLQ38041.1 S26 family signal peptidase [Micromonospora ferruginea]
MSAVLFGAAVLFVAGMVALRARMTLVTVIGMSMAPTLLPGDRVMVRRVSTSRIRRGDVIVLRVAGPCRPGDSNGEGKGPWLVKRVAAGPGEPMPAVLPSWIRGSGVVEPAMFVVLGDNPGLSRDSRHFGAVPAEGILGVVVRKAGGGSVPAPVTSYRR